MLVNRRDFSLYSLLPDVAQAALPTAGIDRGLGAAMALLVDAKSAAAASWHGHTAAAGRRVAPDQSSFKVFQTRSIIAASRAARAASIIDTTM